MKLVIIQLILMFFVVLFLTFQLHDKIKEKKHSSPITILPAGVYDLMYHVYSGSFLFEVKPGHLVTISQEPYELPENRVGIVEPINEKWEVKIEGGGGPGDNYYPPGDKTMLLHFPEGQAPDKIKPEDLPTGAGGADIPYVYGYNKNDGCWELNTLKRVTND